MAYFQLIKNFFRLRANNKKTYDQMKTLQDQRLRELLKHAYDYSLYYRNAFEKKGITKEQIDQTPLTEFPTIDKTILMEQFDSIVTVKDLKQEEIRTFDTLEINQKKLFKDKYHLVHSSGSTGKPGYFVYDSGAWQEMLLGIIRGALWDMSTKEVIKLLIQRPKIVYIAATDGRYGGAMAVGGGIEGLHMEQLFLDIKTPLAQWITSIEQFQPNIVIGYPSAIKILGELVEKGQVHVDIARVISCGEPLGTNLRRYLEKVFCAKVINIYGASESLALGVETSSSEGMYLFDDLNIIEVLDDSIYLTSLYNKVQPLIRYKISDQLELKQGADTDNIPFTRVKSILGRQEDLLWFEKESGEREFLHPLAIEGFCIEGLIDYQFRQMSKTAFEMIAEVNEVEKQAKIEQEMMHSMTSILKQKHLEHIMFSICFTDYIAPDPQTGKKRLIIQFQDANKTSV